MGDRRHFGDGQHRREDPFSDDSGLNEASGSDTPNLNSEEAHAGISPLTLNDSPLIPHIYRGPTYEKNRLYEELAVVQAPRDEFEVNLKDLEKSADEQFVATFVDGQQVSHVIDRAIVLDVEVTFMSGADASKVNRMEQAGMTDELPDQKTARWRVNTAGTLLSDFNVGSDLSIVRTDKTAEYVAGAKARGREPFEGLQGPPSQSLTKIHKENKSATIDSSRVYIVNNLSDPPRDVQSTLIEVDGKPLLALIFNCRDLIFRVGPQLDTEDTVVLLESMIEDARRLCERSPNLFRMKTRSHIIRSKNTRYGIDDGRMFRTLTTSRGIREIISLSASYFNSLDGTDRTQKLIRPKFLQMIVLLLSLLNDDDLSQLSGFLQSTYQLRADRWYIELVILKVLPLRSINSKVFINALIKTFEVPQLPPIPQAQDTPQTYPTVWSTFVKTLLEYECILPGTVRDLGQESGSWVIMWPSEGFKSSEVFSNLQYAGEGRIMNEIPPIRFKAESSAGEAIAIFTDQRRYTVDSEDIQKITNMVSGRYVVYPAERKAQSSILEISEEQVNGSLYEAIRITNSILRTLASYFASPQRRGLLRIRSAQQSDSIFQDIKGSGRLTRCKATLGDEILSVSYRVEGRNITKKDLLRLMNGNHRTLKLTIKSIESKIDDIRYRRIGGLLGRELNENIARLKKDLEQVKDRVLDAEENMHRVDAGFIDVEEEPIVKVIYPTKTEEAGATTVWESYKASYRQDLKYLVIEAKRHEVRLVNWLSRDAVELHFVGTNTTVIVTPLESIPEEDQDDEVTVGDTVLFVGQYLLVIEKVDGYPPSSYTVPERAVNFLKLTSTSEEKRSRRGKNRERTDSRFVTTHLC
ncbi:MAG: hypothetical protein M1840_005239 [Geoglossum simile]|nr:MAG: hypothetical protein M1840_005239 [Geoglossum simile]